MTNFLDRRLAERMRVLAVCSAVVLVVVGERGRIGFAFGASTMVENLSCASDGHPTVSERGTWTTNLLGYECYSIGAVHDQLAPDIGSDGRCVMDLSLDATNVSWTTDWHTLTTTASNFSGGTGRRAIMRRRPTTVRTSHTSTGRAHLMSRVIGHNERSRTDRVVSSDRRSTLCN